MVLGRTSWTRAAGASPEGTTMRFRRTSAAAVIAATVAIASVVGCSEDDGIGARYHVGGLVKYKGEPVTRGTVTFVPDDKGAGRTATGDIQSNGSYTLTTATASDGALPGKYRVSISAVEIDGSVTEGKVGGMYRVDILAKAPRKVLVPLKYGDPYTSGLTAEVKPESNTRDFDLSD
jgi:hypothetical protein